MNRQLSGGMKTCRMMKLAPTASLLRSSTSAVLFAVAILLGVFISGRWIQNTSTIATSAAAIETSDNRTVEIVVQTVETQLPEPPPPPIKPFTCPAGNLTGAKLCPSTPPFPTPPLVDTTLQPSSPHCPEYFRWIHEDLRPWKATGITEEMVERARKTAHFRLVVLQGRVYVEQYRKSFQTRDTFTVWGILQLLRRYPGRVPDLDLVFDCEDWPAIKASDYSQTGDQSLNVSAAPPPLFAYCTDDYNLDIVIPDWSFWGWPEINIRPWVKLKEELRQGNERVGWMHREPYAYWKGNPEVGMTRQELLKCNVSESQDWNARVYAQDWNSETSNGFKQSDLASQCIHRYKIYVEGLTWSVSEKYILACNSLTLLMSPRYHDFFSRGLMPVHHYWPIRDGADNCRSIKFAVDWGNSHKQKAQAIGREASKFIQEQLEMDYIYDYMLHLLSEYAKLLKYKPTVPPGAIEWCSESVACPDEGLGRKYMMESMVKAPSETPPCTLPPQFTEEELKIIQKRKANSIKRVNAWEQKAWDSQQSKT